MRSSSFLVKPLNEAWIGKYGTDIPKIIYTNLTEAFFTRVKLASSAPWSSLSP